jgi:hypothetical protein
MGKKSLFLGILLLTIMFNAVSNFIWLKLDTRIPTDEAEFHIMRLDIYDMLRHHYPIRDKIRDIFTRANYYPPFFLFSAAVVNIFFGTSLIPSVMTNILYLALLLFSVYQIGKKIDTAATGLLAAMVLSLYPAVFGLSRYFQIEFALCAMVCFSIYCLLYSDNFRNRNYSLLFGVSVGFGMLTKWNFAFFILGPLCCVLIEMIVIFIKQNIESRTGSMIGRLKMYYLNASPQLANISWFLLIAFSIAGIYYIKFLQINDLFKYAGTESTRLRWFGLKNIFFYFFELINDQTSFFFFSVFVLALLPLKISKSKPKNMKVLVAWILIPYLIFTFIFARKSGVYIFSFVPAIALITASGLIRIRSRLAKTIVISMMLIWGLTRYFNLSFGIGLSRRDLSFNTPIGSIDLIYKPHLFSEPRYFANRIFCCPPVTDNYMRSIMEEILECIEKYRDKSSKVCSIALDPFAYSCKGLVFDPTWILFLREKNRESSFKLEILSPQWRNFVKIYASILVENSNFWIVDNDVKEDGYIDFFRQELRYFNKSMRVNNREVKEEELELFRNAIAKYKLIKQVPLEEDARIYVYSREN